jgi:DNA-binding transcriptional LysR family regulator
MADSPPLQAIRVCDAVARHLSFTKAAGELAMTQSAVSYQIKLLESFVGGPLFVRMARGVALTDRGLAMAPVVRQSLAELNRVFRSRGTTMPRRSPSPRSTPSQPTGSRRGSALSSSRTPILLSGSTSPLG